MGDAADPRDGRRTFIVPAIKPFDHYDFSRAKIACNLAWLVAKAFGTAFQKVDEVNYSPAEEIIQSLKVVSDGMEHLKEDDECIVNQDELAMNYQEQGTSPCNPPREDQKASPQTPSKENIYEGDLGLGSYELKLEKTPSQSQMN